MRYRSVQNMLSAVRTSAEKFDLGFAEEDRVWRRQRDRTIDAEDGDLKLVARLYRFAENDAVRHVEALNGRGARPSGGARHLPVDPDFRVVVDGEGKHDARAIGFELADFF